MLQPDIFIILSFWWQLRTHYVVARTNAYRLRSNSTRHTTKLKATQQCDTHNNSNKKYVERLAAHFFPPFVGLSFSVATRNRFKRLITCDMDGYYNIMWLYAAYLYAKCSADDLSKRWIHSIHILDFSYVRCISLPERIWLIIWCHGCLNFNCYKLWTIWGWGFGRSPNLRRCQLPETRYKNNSIKYCI